MDSAFRRMGPTTLAVGGLALLTAAGAILGGYLLDIARVGAAVAFSTQIILELRDGRKRFLTSPLFLLSGLGVLLFSTTQGIWGPVSPWPAKGWDFTGFFGSQAEVIILVFGMASLVLYLFTSRDRPLERPSNASDAPYLSDKICAFLFLLTAVITLLDVAIYSSNIIQLPFPSFLAKTHFIVPPLVILSLCLLLHGAPARGRAYKLSVFLLAMAAFGGLAYVREGKIVMFMLVAISFYAVRLFDFSPSQLILAGLASLLVTLIFVQIIQQTRWNVTSGVGEASASYARILQSKGVLRQTETGYCLDNVLKAHADDPFEISKQFFWVKGLVPRILWPEKPSLSFGKKYAGDYCSRSPIQTGQHSSSITLLGQPLIQGGLIGLIFHGGLLLLGLAVVERFNANPTALSTAMVTAMLPWLIDFDQDFALYVANAVKFGLVMMVLFVPVTMIERRATDAG